MVARREGAVKIEAYDNNTFPAIVITADSKEEFDHLVNLAEDLNDICGWPCYEAWQKEMNLRLPIYERKE